MAANNSIGERLGSGAHRDTIYALSSGAPPAGVAVVRISGDRAGQALDALTGRARPAPRRAVLRGLHDEQGGLLDRALLLWLPGPGSATGEDMAELHLHGGRAVVAAVLAALGRAGYRQAAPGEFTRRGYELGRIDLIEAEALGDLLTAETESQRRNAMILAGGALSRAIEGWQAAILRMSAMIEAALDFSDEIDVGEVDSDLIDEAKRVLADIDLWRGRPSAERLRDGVRVVLGGPPNAGKSTLLNTLVGRDAAIVTPIAGTTRDLIEVPAAIGGVPFLFTDTAGLHAGSGDSVENIGIDRAQRALAAADIVLWLGDPAEAPAGALLLAAKADLARSADVGALRVSARSGEGMAELIDALLSRARELLPVEGEAALSERQRAGIEAVRAALAEAVSEDDPILFAEGLRFARGALDGLTGRAGTEDMLDGLFGRFCIGK